MRKATIAGGVAATVLLFLAFAVLYWALRRHAEPAAATSPADTISPAVSETHPGPQTHQGFLYGRITATDGATYEGRLRWGGGEEAFWGDYFNGYKDENPWAAHAPPEHFEERRPIEILGFEIAGRKRRTDLGRPFMGRFGDIARIEALGRDLRVTLKSGTVLDLDRFAADDLADGVRVWDAARGVVDLDERRIRTIELLPTPPLDAAPYRLHGTVHTRQGEFTGFVQWDREEGVGTDEIVGYTAEGKLRLRFETVRSIGRRSRDGCLVTLLDGREIVLFDTRQDGRGNVLEKVWPDGPKLGVADTREVGHHNRGMYVDDRRYGRVLVSWDAFQRVDFSPGGGGPVYDDFPPGHPLTGSVTTRAGLRLAGRLVYDLDESETTETLDAPYQGVDYTIPFGLIATLVPAGREERDALRARVTLHSGEALELEPAGDLGEGNAGVLVFVDGRERAEYVPWTDVERVDFDRPPAMYPPLAGR